jgi:hypothetical protein
LIFGFSEWSCFVKEKHLPKLTSGHKPRPLRPKEELWVHTCCNPRQRKRRQWLLSPMITVKMQHNKCSVPRTKSGRLEASNNGNHNCSGWAITGTRPLVQDHTAQSVQKLELLEQDVRDPQASSMWLILSLAVLSLSFLPCAD